MHEVPFAVFHCQNEVLEEESCVNSNVTMC